ncbi:MAG TPA: hypothetical protein VF438_03610 [Candidatus Paceibacterota bacterium]
MSKQEIVKSLRSEIKRINRIIDQKILLGAPYALESRRHKFLTSQLNRIAPQGTGWFSRSMNFVSLFML